MTKERVINKAVELLQEMTGKNFYGYRDEVKELLSDVFEAGRDSKREYNGDPMSLMVFDEKGHYKNMKTRL